VWQPDKHDLFSYCPPRKQCRADASQSDDDEPRSGWVLNETLHERE
jgi:hypothetical protein